MFLFGRLKYAFAQKHASSPGVFRIPIQNDDSNDEKPICGSGMGWKLAQRNTGDVESRDWYWWSYWCGQSVSTGDEKFGVWMMSETDGLLRVGSEDVDFDAFVKAEEEEERERLERKEG